MMRRRSRCALGFVGPWLATACTAPAPLAHPALREMPPQPSVRASAPPARAPDQRVAAALRRVVRVRGLAPKAPIRTQVVSRDRMVRVATAELDAEIPADVMSATEDLFYGLGLVNADFDYRRETTALLGQELGGLYDAHERTLYVDEQLRAAEGQAALDHEIVHALQDQYYGLERITGWQDDGTDAQTAAHCLAEGDATSAMLDALLEGSGKTALDLGDDDLATQIESGETARSSATPGVLIRSLIEPYVDGTRFVHRLRRDGGWAAVDAAWKQVPESTEQLLEPAKWTGRDPPQAVPIPSAGEPWHLVYHDVLGEQSVRIVLEEWISASDAEAAAANWSGDRVAVFADGDRRRIAWRIRYDTLEAATVGFEAFARAPGLAAGKGGTRCAERPDRGPFALVVAGRDVVLTAGPFARRGGGPAASGCAEAEAAAHAVLDER